MFETIFKLHCGYGGVLQKYNVSEIFARVVWFRARWFLRAREENWGEPPIWIKEIPVPVPP